jgi:uncharacterized protein YcfL
MKTWLALALPCLALMACTEEPSRKTAEEASTILVNEAAQTAVKEKQQSIEEAAEQATKLIEADVKAEIDATKSSAVE